MFPSLTHTPPFRKDCNRMDPSIRRDGRPTVLSFQPRPPAVEQGAEAPPRAHCVRLAHSRTQWNPLSPWPTSRDDRLVPNPLHFQATAVPGSLISAHNPQSKGFPPSLPPLFFSTFLETLTLHIYSYSWPKCRYWVTFKILLGAEWCFGHIFRCCLTQSFRNAIRGPSSEPAFW